MSFRNIIIVIVASIVLLLAIIGEGYFYFYSEKQNNVADTVIQSIQNILKAKQPSDELAQVKSDLEAQTKKLKQMQADFPSSPSLDASIKKDISAVSAAAAKADSLAADPKLDIPTRANIIILGQKATQALSYLQFLADNGASTVALNDAAENAVELTAAYINELSDYVDSLTPSNSGLTSSEINDYVTQADDVVTQINSAQNSLNQIDSIPESSINDGTLVSNTPSTISALDNNSNNPTLTASSTTYPLSTSSDSSGQNQVSEGNGSNNGTVTLGDIAAQENVVTQITNEVDQLSDQIEAEATSSTDSSDVSSTSSSSSSDNSGSDNNSGNGSYTGNNNNNGADNSSNQAQDQNGSVKLIEGENTF